VTDCPNCAVDVDAGVELCPACGFHVLSQQADAVRRLREEGVISARPCSEVETMREGDPRERAVRTDLPAEDRAAPSPREIDAGL
jgi:hypothetical protein